MASNDDMAIGAALALHAAGKRLPQDVSLLGFDDIRMARVFPAAADHRACAGRRNDSAHAGAAGRHAGRSGGGSLAAL
ncbi:substrate-binding domain-containing protein [Pantoea ananatis]